MTFGRYNPRRRYLERGRKRNNALLFTSLTLISIGVVGFWLGRQHSAYQLGSLRKENEDSRQQITDLQNQITKLRAESQTANLRFNQLRTQYEKDLPEEGAMRELVELVRNQLAEGMAADRLAFVIRSTRPPRNCTDPASKRFMVKTPAYTGPDSIASFGEDAVTVSAQGASSRNEAGNEESWYDSSQPVTVVFKTAGGHEQKQSVLPIQHSLIAAGREYRFTLSEGEKSFIKVTFDSCDYP